MLFFIILVLTIAGSFILPWSAAAIIAFIAAICCAKTSGQAFWSGFGAVFIAWMMLALFKSIPNNHILATRVSRLFHLPNWAFVLVITALIGGIVGGMAALSGVLVKKVFEKQG